MVLEGSGRVKLDDEIVELKRWDVLRVGPSVGHQFEAGPDGDGGAGGRLLGLGRSAG